jgi:probable phosphoglycerate mutase
VRGHALAVPDAMTAGERPAPSTTAADADVPVAPSALAQARAGLALLEHGFVFLRHGESIGNRDALIAGSMDVALTERGRARDTAAVVAASRGLPVVTIAELGERHWGALEGRPRSERTAGTLPPGAEPHARFAGRVCRGLARIPAEGLPVVCAHSGVWRIIAALLGLEPREAPIGNAQPVRIRSQGQGWSIEPLDGATRV